MEQKDYLKRQIDQFAEAIAGILGSIISVPQENQNRQKEMVEEEFMELFDTKIEYLLEMDAESYFEFLISKKISDYAIEQTTMLLYKYDDLYKNSGKNLQLNKINHLTKYLDENNIPVSFEMLQILANKKS